MNAMLLATDHAATSGEVPGVLCLILLILWVIGALLCGLSLLGVSGYDNNRFGRFGVGGPVVGTVVLLVLWLVLC